MTKSTQHLAPSAIFVSGTAAPASVDSAPPLTLADLEHLATRHVENLASIRSMEAYHSSEIERLEGAIAEFRASVAQVEPSTDGGVAATYQLKRRIVELERDRDVALHEIRCLQPQLADELSRAEATEKAIAAARAKLGQ